MNDELRRNHARPRCNAAALDRQFDRLLPRELRHLSLLHWTPADVAVRAARLLSPSPKSVTLDVGSGVGKLCSIGALSAPGTWVGVEHHASLVATAAELARELGVAERTRYIETDAFAVDWNDFDALYFYNPFELALFGERRSAQQLATDSSAVESRLARLPPSILTFHGFGGVMPSTFELLHHEKVVGHDLALTLWQQRPRSTVFGGAS